MNRAAVLGRLADPVRRVRGRARRALTPPPPPPLTPGRYDWWVEHAGGERLEEIERACAAGEGSLALFRDLDVDLWALLLTQEQERFPHIRALLPDVPDPALQALWNGASGAQLAEQSRSFYAKTTERFREHADGPLERARVLDFGCGWGRLTRMFARDVAPGHLFGCDPSEDILEVCRQSRVPATLARTEFVPERLPFAEPFDLAFSFSVFTHLSERAHESCLRALHAALRPGAVLVVTVRPPEYLRLSELMRPALAELGPDPRARLAEPRYVFVPHPAEPSHFQYEGGEMTYGETVVTLPYVRERWAPLFELVAVDALVGDLQQVMLTLRRR